jgi:hypothetical protein
MPNSTLSMTGMVLLCVQGETMCNREAAVARAIGDDQLAAWWDGRAADWRRYLHELGREFDVVREARAAFP